MAGGQALEDRRSEYIRLDDSAEVGRFETVRTVLRLLGLLRSYKRRAALAMAIDTVHIFTLVATPWVIRLLIDDYVTEGRAVSEMVRFLAVLAGLALAQYVSQRASSVMLTALGLRLLYDMRTAIFDQLLRLSMTFYDRNQVGRVMSRAQNDVQQVQGVMNIGWLFISEMFILAGVAAGMLAMDLRLGVLSLVTVVLIFPVVVFWQRFARVAYVRARQTMADVNTRLQENLTAVRVVQSLGREEANLRSFDEANRASEKANIEATRFGAALMPSVEALNSIGLALVVSIGGMLALGGSLEVGVLVAFALYITRFFEPVERLTSQYNVLQRAVVSTMRIFEIMDIRPLLQDRPGAPALPPVRGAIRYEGVDFHYFEDTPVLRGVDLRIEPGETVALVGPTGAGKTTLVSLLMRFYDVKEGRITIDGRDLRDVRLESLSRQMGVVLQEPHLFAGTVAENIRYCHTEASNEAMFRAAKAVGIHDFIMGLEKGYETTVEEGGSNLSVGQRQLMSFARALVADPRILILDEATANIDTESEVLVQRALKELLRDRTAVVIAHRLSTIRDADRIVALGRAGGGAGDPRRARGQRRPVRKAALIQRRIGRGAIGELGVLAGPGALESGTVPGMRSRLPVRRQR